MPTPTGRRTLCRRAARPVGGLARWIVAGCGVQVQSMGRRRGLRAGLLVGASVFGVAACAGPALADCAAGDGQLTGPGAACSTPQTLTGSGQTGTVATGWTLDAGAADAYTVGGTNNTLGNAGSITSSAADQSVDLSGGGASLTNSGAIANTGSGAAIAVTAASGGAIDNTATGQISAASDAIHVAGDITGAVSSSGAITSTGGSGIVVVGNAGSVTNDGHITASLVGIQAGLSLYNVGGGTLYFLSSLGDTANGAVAGDIRNTGEIDAGYGVFANVVDGDIVNSGTIKAKTLGITADAVQGSVTNSGAITVTAGAGLSFGPPVGANGTGGNVGGDIVNTATGTITASDRGITVAGAVSGKLSNAGSISGATWGVFVAGDVTQDVIDTGSITGTSNAALQVNGSVGGDLTLTGTLAGAKGAVIGGAVGGSLDYGGGYTGAGTAVYVYGGVTGDLLSTGTVAGAGPVIDIDQGGVGGKLTNSAPLSGLTEGIYIGNGFSIYETGTQTVQPPSSSSIYVGGSFSGALNNSGAINAAENGIFLNGGQGDSIASLTNSGAITTTSTADGAGNDLVSNITIAGDVINSGKLVGVNGANLRAVGGNFDNSGVVQTTSEGFNLTSVGGSIVNSGAVTTSQFGLVFNSVVGSVTNTATGSLITSYVPSGTVYGGGIRGGTVGGDLVNAGQISGPGIGVYVDKIGGWVRNSGVISSGDGLYVGGPIGLGFDNAATGQITGSAGPAVLIGGQGGDLNGPIDLDVGGPVSNEGSISGVTYGFYAGTVHGDFSNTGTISASGGDAVHLLGDVLGDLTDGGTITATGYGVYVAGQVTGDVALAAGGTISPNTGGAALAVFGNVGGTLSLVAGRTIQGGAGQGGAGAGIVVGQGAPGSTAGQAPGIPGNYSGSVAAGAEVSAPANLAGAAVYVGGTVAGGLVVHGTVGSTGTAAIKVGDGAASTITGGVNLTTDGVISGGAGVAIDYSGATGASTLTLAGGSVTGDIALSAHGDTLDITGGTLDGGVYGAAASGTSTVGTVNVQLANGASLTPGGQIDVAAINVQSGRLIAAGGAAIGDGAHVAVSGGATFEAAASETIGSLSGAGAVQLDAGAVLTTGADGTSSGYSGAIGGTGGLAKAGAGTFTLSGADGYLGATVVNGGTLLVNGTLASPTVAVNAGGTLGGTGTLAGAVNVGEGGTLAGVAGQTLTVGSLTLAAGSSFDATLGAPSSTGLIRVNGDLALGGTLNVSAVEGVGAGGFGAGVYRLIDYTGDLTGGTLAVGAVPDGTTAGDLAVQTSVSGQVNLVYGSASSGPLTFWNGSTTSPTGAVVGGSGTWSADAGHSNWTGQDGAVSGPWTGGLAVFEGAAGSVTVDDGAGAVGATGLQFAAGGYQLDGDALTLTGPATVRVGDGTSGGAAYVATIGAPIAGSAGLTKTDLGTLVLSGANRFTGGLTLGGGLVEVSADANLGDASGAVGFAGGDLEATASFTSARRFDVGAAGSLVVASGADLTLTGPLTGAGDLTKAGAGTLDLQGASAYAGALTVAGGTLQVDASLGATSVTVQSGGALAGGGSIAGAVSVADGGTLAGSAGKTLTVGSLTLSSGAALNVALGAPSSQALFAVNGALSLDGTLNVGAVNGVGAGGFGVGVYRLIDYGGALTDNGLAIGATPTGVPAADLAVQTSVGGQVNLVYATSDIGPIGFWNGGRTTADGSIAGGSGTWRLGVTNWTDAAGAASGTWSGGFAVFEGAAGAVAVDDGAGQVRATGLQFAADGYRLTGDALALSGDATIRVGDGTAGGAAYVATIDAPVTGSGGLAKTDLGTLSLTATDSFAGAVAVQGGTLSVDGVLTAPTLAVDAGATLAGTGAIVGAVTVASGGTYSPGHSPGTSQVTGSVTFATGSTYLAQVTGAGAHDLIAVTGSAAIQSGATLQVQPLGVIGDYGRLTSVQILTATAGISGTFSNVSSDLAFLTPHLTYGANAVDLALTRNDITFASLGQTPNQQAVGAAAEAGGFGTPLYMALVTQDGAGARQGYDALSGELYASLPTILMSQSDLIRRALVDRMEGADGGAGEAAGVWAQAAGAWSRYAGAGGVAGAHASLGGATIGGDAPLGGWRLGVGASYQQDSIGVAARASSAFDRAGGIAAYAAGQAGPISLRLGGGYVWHSVRTARDVAFPGFTDHTAARFGAGTGQVFGEAGWRVGVAGWRAEPFAGIAVDTVSVGHAAEAGGAAALQVAGEDRTVVSTRLGLRASLPFGAANLGGVSLHWSADWRHASDDLAGRANAAFAGTGQGFDLAGLPIARDVAEVGAGISVKAGARSRIDVSYAGQLAGRWQDHSVRLRADWAF